MKVFAEAEWDRARRSLLSARNLSVTDPDTSASAAYYAVFHALSALFAVRAKKFTKHTGLRAAVHRDLIKSGEWPQELGEAFEFCMRLRETGDYGGITRVTSEQADEAIKMAEIILKKVIETCPGFTKTD